MIRFRFVQDHEATFEVKRMCELVEVPRSSYYAWTNHTPSARELADAEFLVTIRDIYQRSRNTYGAPRVYGQLRRTGHRVARCRVARLMRVNGLVGAHASKKWRRGRPDAGGLSDLLQRNFTATAPNQRWVADVTEFATRDGKFYLAAVRDLFHRGIVGWDISGRGSIWFETRAESHAYLFEFIEVFYNRQRHQGGLGHLTPVEYADKWRHDHGEPNLA